MWVPVALVRRTLAVARRIFAVAFERGLGRQADAEQRLRHAIVQFPRNSLSLVVKQSIAFGRFHLSAQPLQAGNHVALLFVQARIADRYRDLVGEDRQQALLLFVVANERSPEERPHGWMPTRRADM